MQLQVQSKATESIHTTPILQQSAFWSQVKRKQGVLSKAFDVKARASDLFNGSDQDKQVEDDMLILFRNIGEGYNVGYVPYGPTMKPGDENQGMFLEELSESLRSHLPGECLLLRYDLLWESLWAKDHFHFNDEGQWTGPPPKTHQELRLNLATKNWNLKKANTNILPSDTIFIDLRKPEKQLLQEMKPKTRYNVRLSGRKGVRVRHGDLSDMDIWYDLYNETCQRNGVFLHDREYFESVLTASMCGGNSSTEVELLIAEIDRLPLSAMFLSFSGKRATYLYGASSSTKRNLMATYALQWEAIRRSKMKGCTEYDMFGVAPRPDPSHPLYGLYRFKTGFGGKIFHRMGCWDYPLDPKAYQAYQTSEMQSHGYHLR